MEEKGVHRRAPTSNEPTDSLAHANTHANTHEKGTHDDAVFTTLPIV